VRQKKHYIEIENLVSEGETLQAISKLLVFVSHNLRKKSKSELKNDILICKSRYNLNSKEYLEGIRGVDKYISEYNAINRQLLKINQQLESEKFRYPLNLTDNNYHYYAIYSKKDKRSFKHVESFLFEIGIVCIEGLAKTIITAIRQEKVINKPIEVNKVILFISKKMLFDESRKELNDFFEVAKLLQDNRKIIIILGYVLK